MSVRNNPRYQLFQHLGQQPFERFACALHEAVEGLTGGRLYAPDGKQHGIDHIVNRLPGQGIEVGQSKDYATFSAAKIKSAADAFLSQWDCRWSGENVRRFILFVACEVKSKTSADEVLTQQRCFAELGLAFELWDAARILEKLGFAPQIVRSHLGEQAHSQLFGKLPNLLDGLTAALAGGDPVALDATQIVSRLGLTESARLVEWRRRLRSGESAKVALEVEEGLTSTADEQALSPALRAEERRMLAGILLNSGSPTRARVLIDEADKLDGTSARLRAMLLMEESGPQAVLDTIVADVVEIAEVRAVALLRLARPIEAEAELQAHLGDLPRAETLRLLAMAALLNGQRNEAVTAAARAVELEPSAHAMVQALAICRYHRALSPAVPVLLGEFPQPFDSAMVQLDDDAVDDLRSAAREFARLVATAEVANRDGLRCWQFASLANARLRDEAQALLDASAAKNEWSGALIAWALARGLQFDRAAATDWATAKLQATPSVASLIPTLILTSVASDSARLKKLVEQHGDIFVREGQANSLAYWRAVVAMERRAAPDPDVLVAQPGLRLRLAVDEKNEVRRTATLVELLEEQLALGSNAEIVLGAAQLLADAGEWHAASRAADYLIRQVGTGEARGLAARSLLFAGEPRRALDALQASSFPGGVLPMDERRLRGACLAQLGEAPAARRQLEAIAGQTGDPADVLRAIQYDLQIGDLRKARALYDQHEDRLGVPTATHLHLANAMAGTDSETAERLVRSASASTDTAMTGMLFMLANRLGLDDIVAQSVKQMANSANDGASGIVTASIEDVMAMMSERQELAEKITQLYLRGQMPVHAFARLSIGGVAQHLLAPLLAAPFAEQPRMALLTRYGRRFDQALWPAQGSVVLRADLTALLTAHGIGLLAEVERAFAPVAIAPSMIIALQAMYVDLVPAQPTRVAAMRRIVDLVSQARIVISENTEHAFLVDWEVAANSHQGLLNLSALFAALIDQLGAVADDARVRMGRTIDQEPLGHVPPDGSRLHLPGGMTVVLAEASLLELAVARFQLEIDLDDHRTIVGELAAIDAKLPVAASILDLTQRLATGIANGRYRLLPMLPSERGPIDPVMRSLEELTSGPFASYEMLWVDDRMVSQFRGAPPATVTTIEVIATLERNGLVPASTADSWRQQLRRARWLFIPLQPDEVVRHLRAAVRDATLTETSDLCVLRRAVGEIVLERRLLQWPSPAQLHADEHGEISSLLDLKRMAGTALSAIWRDPSWKLADAEVASEWLVEHLDPGFYPLPAIEPDDPRSDDLLGIHLSGLMMGAIEFLPRKASAPRREAMLKWLWFKVVEPMLAMRPQARKAFFGSLEQLFVTLLESDVADPIQRHILALAINAFPEAARVQLLSRPALRSAFGMKDGTIVTVGPHAFTARLFFETILACENSPITVRDDAGSEVEFAVVRSDAGRHLTFSADGKMHRIDDWPLRIASHEADVRRAALDERSQALDLSHNEFVQLGNEIVQAAPLDSVLRINALIAASPEAFYTTLASNIAARVPFQVAELFPASIADVLSSLRMHAADIGLDDSARRLIVDCGLRTAIERLSCLPVEPPSPLIDAVNALPEVAWCALARELLDLAMPWTTAFVAALCNARPARTAVLEMELDLAILAACSTDALDTAKVWVAAAQFAEQHGPTQADWSSFGALQQLAACWYNAGRVATLVARGGVLRLAAVDALVSYTRAQPRALVEPITAFEADCAAPHSASAHKVTIYLLGAEMARLIERGSAGAEPALTNLLVIEEDGVVLPRAELLRGALNEGNVLGSVFRRRLDRDIGITVPGAEVLFGGGAAAQIQYQLLSANTWSDRAKAMALLRYAIDNGTVPEDIRPSIVPTIDATEIEAVPENLRMSVALHLASLARDTGCQFPETARKLVSDAGVAGDFALRSELAFAIARTLPVAERPDYLAGALLSLQPFSIGDETAALLRAFGRGLSGLQSAPFVRAIAQLVCGHAETVIIAEGPSTPVVALGYVDAPSRRA